MSIEENVQTVKDFFAAMGGGNKQDLLALVAEDIEWIIPGEDWPLAGTRRGHAELAAVLQKASEEVEMTYPEPPEFVLRETGFWSSASLRGKSKPRISRSRTIGSSTLPFEMAK
jgi:ketosteroid isomerase-like protein